MSSRASNFVAKIWTTWVKQLHVVGERITMNTHGGIKTKPRINPWLVAGLTVILGLAVSVFTVRNVHREKEHMVQNFLELADALI